MWFDQEEEESCGFVDPVSDGIAALVAAFVVGLIAYLTWAHQAGKLPLWG